MTIANPNSPIHPSFDERVSVKVEGQLPQFVKENHSTFIAFLAAYYEYMEQEGKAYETIGNLQSYVNLDKTTDDFLDYFKKQFGQDIPEAVFANANKPHVLKHLRDFYRTKGSEKSFQFLFRLLNQEEIDFYYPTKDILRVSDGKYKKDQVIRCVDTSGNDAIFDLVGNEVTGSLSGATAMVELILQEHIGDFHISTIYLSNTAGTFLLGETITYGPDTYTLGGMITDYNITKPGNNYSVGDKVTVTGGGGSGEGALITVDELTTGTITQATIVDGGTLYQVGDELLIDNTDGLDIDGRTCSIVVKEVSNTGIVEVLEITNPGYGYVKVPTVTSAGSTGFNLSVILSGESIGGVQTLKITNNGFGYESNPECSLATVGDGTAKCNLIASGYEDSFKKGWVGDDGFISAGNYIQDSHYYQLFSYVITSGQSINNWREIVKRVVHPAGLALFGNVQLLTTLDHTLNITGIPARREYKIIWFDGTIEPPVVAYMPVDSCVGEIELIFVVDDDYLTVDLPNDPVTFSDDYGLVTQAITYQEDWGLSVTGTYYVAPTICQTVEQDLHLQLLRTMEGFEDYLYVYVNDSRFDDYQLITEDGITTIDWGYIYDEVSFWTQLRLGPIRRKLDHWKFRTQGGFGQGEEIGGSPGPLVVNKATIWESGQAIGPFLDELIFDWRDLGGLKQRNLTSSTITQWNHVTTPDITYGSVDTQDFLTNVYGTTDQILPPPNSGGP